MKYFKLTLVALSLAVGVAFFLLRKVPAKNSNELDQKSNTNQLSSPQKPKIIPPLIESRISRPTNGKDTIENTSNREESNTDHNLSEIEKRNKKMRRIARKAIELFKDEVEKTDYPIEVYKCFVDMQQNLSINSVLLDKCIAEHDLNVETDYPILQELFNRIYDQSFGGIKIEDWYTCSKQKKYGNPLPLHADILYEPLR